MKTAMKKLFSLLLVAVLLVGVFPMAAFADETYFFWFELHVGGNDYTGKYIEVAPGTTFTDEQILDYAKSFWPDAFPEDYTYTVSGSTAADQNHNGADINVTAVTTPDACEHCGSTEHASADCITLCDKNSACDAATHYEDCPKHFDYVAPATNATVKVQINNSTYAGSFTIGAGKNANDVYAEFLDSSMAAQYEGATGPVVTLDDMTTAISATEAGETYYLWLSWEEPATTPDDDSDSDDNSGNTTIPSGNRTLKVMANLYVGEELNKSILLAEIDNLSADALIYQVISANKDYLVSRFPAGYNGFFWTQAVYYHIDADTTATVNTRMTVGDEDHVFINLYSDEKLVVVRVHTSETYHVDRSVQVGGFRVGELVTYDDVLEAVEKYYDVSDMTMYTYSQWEKVIAGKDASPLPYFTVHSGDNVYEVYVDGYYKTSSGSSYKADSSNPKTGDMIMNSVVIMTASAACLAALFFLNKKRAY